MSEVQFETGRSWVGDETLLVTVRGEIDLSTAPELERVLDTNGTPCGRVVVDLSDCTFIDSSGLRVLVNADRRTSPKLVVVANVPIVLRTFEASGLVDHFTLHRSMESALNGASGSG